MSKVIHIEICESYNGNKFNIKIGDIVGSTESSNITKMEVLEEVSDAIDEMFLEPSGDEPDGCGKEINGLKHYEIFVYCGDIINENKILCKDCIKKSKSETDHSQEKVSLHPSVNGLQTEANSGDVGDCELPAPSPDTSKPKESKIADELNKDYPNIKNYPNEDPSDFCKKCGTMLIYSKQEKVFICPKCVKTKEEGTNAQ